MRIKPGNTVIYYSPSTRMGGGERLQAFTAVGVVCDVAPYPFDMGGGFVPHRRDVRYVSAQPARVTQRRRTSRAT